MSTTKKIFVLIPVFNAGKFLAQAIESVLSQTYRDWKLLVLDDCSTDESFLVAQHYSQVDTRIEVQRNDSNLGMLANWNKGLSLCNHEYFVKLDADDFWHPFMLEKAMGVLTRFPDVALVFSKYCKVDVAGQKIPGSEIVLPEFARNLPFSCIPLVKSGASQVLSFEVLRQGLSIIRKKIVDQIGPYRQLITPETQGATDTEFYFRVGCHSNIYCMDEMYYFYRVHEGSVTQIDQRRNLSERKMFEIKSVIYDYYYNQNKITYSEWRKNKRQINFSFWIFLAYHYRKNLKVLPFLKVFSTLLITHPLETMKFYMSRLNMNTK